MKEINWRKELLDSKQFNEKEKKLLESGATSLGGAYWLGALYSRYKRIKGIVDPPDPDLQSSFKEWNKDYE